jgi:alkylhydroperoxidase family enzyme
MAHLLDDPLPQELYRPEEAAVVRYARKSTRMEPIDDATYADLARHFDRQQIIDLCLTVGLSNMVNRFHATFLTDVDGSTLAEVEAGNAEPGVCPIPLPRAPGG